MVPLQSMSVCALQRHVMYRGVQRTWCGSKSEIHPVSVQLLVLYLTSAVLSRPSGCHRPDKKAGVCTAELSAFSTGWTSCTEQLKYLLWVH